MVLLPTEVKRFEESMFSCTSREVACQEYMRQGMLLKAMEIFNDLQMFHTISIS